MLFVVITSLVAVVGMVFLGRALSFNRSKAQRRRGLKQLGSMISLMSRHLQVLDSQTQEYFNTLHENGLGEILRIHDALVVVDSELHDHLARGDLQRFDALLALALEQRKIPRSLTGVTTVNVDFLRDWPKRVDEKVLMLTQVLAQARSQTGSLGIDRTLKQVPTAVALEELHKLIQSGQFEDRAGGEASLS